MALDTRAKRHAAMGSMLPWGTLPPIPDEYPTTSLDRASVLGGFLPEGDSEFLTPAAIMTTYIIETLDLLTWPTDSLDWPCYISHQPDGNNVNNICGAVFDTTGVRDARLLRTGLVIEHPGIQILLRTTDYETGYSKAQRLALALDAIANQLITIDATIFKIINCSRTAPVASLGKEPGTKRRDFFSLNYLLTYKTIE